MGLRIDDGDSHRSLSGSLGRSLILCAAIFSLSNLLYGFRGQRSFLIAKIGGNDGVGSTNEKSFVAGSNTTSMVPISQATGGLRVPYQDVLQARSTTKNMSDLSAALITGVIPQSVPFPSSVTVSTATLPPGRILLGIDSQQDARPKNTLTAWRHIIRQTHLDFERLYRYDEPNPVCSLRSFRSAPDQFSHCRLIYAFVVPPAKNKVDITIPRGEELVYMPSNNWDHDLLVLNVDENDTVGKYWGWFRYASSFMQKVSRLSFAAYSTTDIMMKPTKFWGRNTLFREDNATGIYGGLPGATKQCKGTCKLTDKFILLSSDVVHHVASQDIPPRNATTEKHPAVSIANAIQSYAMNHKVRKVELQGLEDRSKDAPYDRLKAFDKYKDSLVNYTDPVEEALVLSKHQASLLLSNKNRKPRLLLGIFTMDSPTEHDRRNAIRETYLQAFVGTETPHRICSVAKLKRMDEEARNACRMGYIFVTGGNPNGATELVDVSDESGPVALEHDLVPESVRLPDHDMGDMVYLNIQENMEDGKSQTYFKYAVSLLDDHYFDYIAKTDTDTLIVPHVLLQQMTKKMPVFPENVRIYAGKYRTSVGPLYMQGQLYMMSPDLARFITSPACHRKAAVTRRVEDSDIGTFISLHPQHIRRIELKGPISSKRPGEDSWYHPVKNVHTFRQGWATLSQKKKKQTRS